MQLGIFIDVFLARHVSGTYAHHQGHLMLSYSIRFSAPSFCVGGGLDSRCVGRVCGADGAVSSFCRFFGDAAIIISSHHHFLTPWSRVLLEKLVKKFPAFYGTRRFITESYIYWTVHHLDS